MFKNYLRLSLKVLKRKPFYTFVSLFGISFTLMILMLLTALFDGMLGSNPPYSNNDRTIMIPTLKLIHTTTDTTLTVDSLLVGQTMEYDTSYSYAENASSTSSGGMSYRFVTDHLLKLEEPVHIALVNAENYVDGYQDGRKFSYNTLAVNAAYYDVFDFNFLYGQRILPDDVEQRNKVVIITDKTARDYFGEVSEAVLGRKMDLSGVTYRVKGIVERPYSTDLVTGGDVFFPMSLLDPRIVESEDLLGGFSAILLGRTPGHTQAVQEEVNHMAENFDLSSKNDFNQMKMVNASLTDSYAMMVVGTEDVKAARLQFFVPLAILVFLFAALPLLNLINLNIGRVAERRAEIGVRKAFGATGRDVLWQFIFENLVITVIGGLIGLLLALVLIQYINTNDLLGITRLSYSPLVFGYFFLVVLFFGFLSGILPAYRMSQTNVANSLR